jgi:septum formation protein
VSVPDESAESLPDNQLAPRDLVEFLARQKAADVARRHREGVILAADTVAVCDGEILGKPRDRDHARQMLLGLSGRRHQVLTGVCVWSRPDNQVRVRSAVSELEMEPLDAGEIEAYLDSGEWVGKAGAFGYQDGLDWLHLIHGSASNVVGLPMELVAEMLGELEREAP